MIRAAAIAFATLFATSAVAFEKLGVVAVADPPGGPDADLAELAHQLRAACRDRIGGVEDVPTMRARLLGQTSNATLSELDRAYGGALAVYQNGEFDSALRTLHAIIDDLESLPETEDSYSQWVRAQLRLAHAALTTAHDAEAEEAFYAIAKTDISIAADPDTYSPTYRRRFDAIKGRVRALPARRLTVIAEGTSGTVFVNGRARGTTPLSLWLPAGVYRIGGAADQLRVPSFTADLRSEDRSVVLDFALAESLRVNAGPGLALPVARRGDGIVRAGAWLGVDRVIAVSRVFEGEAAFLLGSFYDVRRGALLREGSVRMIAGTVPAANLGALAAFLLTGQSSRDVKDRTDPTRPPPIAAVTPPPPVAPPPPVVASATPATSHAAPPAATKESPAPNVEASVAKPPPALPAAATSGKPVRAETAPFTIVPPPARAPEGLVPQPRVDEQGSSPRWMRPTAIGSAVAAVAFTALASQQGFSARNAYSKADAMISGSVLLAGSDPDRYRELRADGDAAKRNAYLSAGAAAAFAAAAGVLGWRSVDRAAPAGTVALRF